MTFYPVPYHWGYEATKDGRHLREAETHHPLGKTRARFWHLHMTSAELEKLMQGKR
jgi:hypothetical protein